MDKEAASDDEGGVVLKASSAAGIQQVSVDTQVEDVVYQVGKETCWTPALVGLDVIWFLLSGAAFLSDLNAIKIKQMTLTEDVQVQYSHDLIKTWEEGNLFSPILIRMI